MLRPCGFLLSFPNKMPKGKQMYAPIKFTKEQLIKGIANAKREAKEYRASLRLALAKHYEDRVKELEAQLTGL